MSQVMVAGLFVYPIKSCRGISLDAATVRATGLAHDRRWMVVNEQGKFVTQREQAHMALIAPQLQGDGLTVTAPGMPALAVAGTNTDQVRTVTVWRDQCPAYDEGDVAATWLSTFLGTAVRLVRFDDAHQRLSSTEFTGDTPAYNQFSDGFAMLAISNASLSDLNSRMTLALPMNRFRPNLVLDGLPAYGEDEVHELQVGGLSLRAVKPCTRCKITTTDQDTGVAQGTEPLSTLMKYRRHPQLRGVTFGQNLIVIAGAGEQLKLGDQLAVSFRSAQLATT